MGKGEIAVERRSRGPTSDSRTRRRICDAEYFCDTDLACRRGRSCPNRVNPKLLLKGTINMTKETPIWPPTDEFSDEFTLKIDGPDGPCYIAWVGGMPERTHTYAYLDRHGKFYFYANRTWSGSTYDVDVYDASVSKFTGATPSIGREWLSEIKANVLAFFQQRSFANSSKPIEEGANFGSLTFSWGIK
jgi:hypothetical protein